MSAQSANGKNSASKPSSFASAEKLILWSSVTRRWFTDNLIISTAVILLLVIVLFLGLSGPTRSSLLRKIVPKDQAQLQLPQSKALFTSANDGAVFDRLIKSNELAKAFIHLKNEYESSPSSEKHQALFVLQSYIRKYFPDQANLVNVDISCREESCGAKFVYSKELSAIRDKIKLEPSLDETEREVILSNLEDAALAAGQDDRKALVNSLGIAFQNLKYVWLDSKDASIKQLAQNLLDLIKSTDQSFYEVGLKVGSLKI